MPARMVGLQVITTRSRLLALALFLAVFDEKPAARITSSSGGPRGDRAINPKTPGHSIEGCHGTTCHTAMSESL
jgi:hypothetical protein